MLAIYDYGLNDAISGSVLQNALMENLTAEDEWWEGGHLHHRRPAPGRSRGSAATCRPRGEPSLSPRAAPAGLTA